MLALNTVIMVFKLFLLFLEFSGPSRFLKFPIF